MLGVWMKTIYSYVNQNLFHAEVIARLGTQSHCGHFLLEVRVRFRLLYIAVGRSRVRPFIMRFDSELLIFIFRSEKKMGLLVQSDFAKSDGIKSDLRIRWPKSSDFGPFRLIITRIRFRASDFGLVAKINIIRAKSKQASCGEIVLGSFVFLLVWLGFWTQKIQANVDYCYVRRRAECTSLRPELKHLSLR